MDTTENAGEQSAAAAPDTPGRPDSPGPTIDNTEIEKGLKARLETSKSHAKTFHGEWKTNVQLRMAHVGVLSAETDHTPMSDDIQSEINPDWYLTKTKIANLYSQVPNVQGTHENKQYEAAVPLLTKALNYELSEKRVNIGVAMEEVLSDVVNAAGIGGCLIGYAARFKDVMMPVEQFVTTPDGRQIETTKLPEQSLQVLAKAGLVHIKLQPKRTSYMFYGTRVSPTDLLWPKEFTGSNFDNADFTGYSGKMPWAEGLREFAKSQDSPNGLVKTDKDEVCGGGERDLQNLRSREDGNLVPEDSILYDVLFYKRYRVNPDETSFKAIWKIVWVKGKETPVYHGPWRGQEVDQDTGEYVGACQYPLRILTTTYISDNPIPPSDSKAGRSQVKDLLRSRNLMFQNRAYNRPLRWFDSNRVGPLVRELLKKGQIQGMIPTNGNGTNVIGEIARAAWPSEDFTFDQMTKQDLMETWQLGQNQMGVGGGGRRTSAEAQITQTNFATRIGQERARVGYFFLGVCQVLLGLMALYSDFPNLADAEKQQLQKTWDSKKVLTDLVLKIRPDSQILLDAGQRFQRCVTILNLTAKSPLANPKPILVELFELGGFDPNECVVEPPPKSPPDPNVSFRFSGSKDLRDPVVMAMLVHAKIAPTPQELQIGKTILMDSQKLEAPPPPETPAPAMAGSDGAPAAPPPAAGASEDAQPDWQLSDKLAKRSRDAGGG